MADSSKPTGKKKAARLYARCIFCDALIKFVKDRKGDVQPTQPGTSVRHKCNGTGVTKSTERDGYI